MSSAPAAAQSLPAGWEISTLGDANPPSVQSARECAVNSVECVAASLAASGNTLTTAADQATFVHHPLAGDGTVIARVAAFSGGNVEAKAGLMVRESLASDARHATIHVSPAFTPVFRWRGLAGAASSRKIGITRGAAVWLKLERRGARLTGYESVDGATWTRVYLADIDLPQQVQVGVVVTSGSTATLADVSVTDLKLLTSAAPPQPWQTLDVGSPTVTGDTSYVDGTFFVAGAGQGIEAQSDQFRYVYRRVVGDADIVAQVAALDRVTYTTMAGLMMRESLTAGSAHASMLATSGKGWWFRVRQSIAGATKTLPYSAGSSVPVWLKLERRGPVVTAFYSLDGSSWINVGAETVSLPDAYYVGLASSSDDPARVAEAAFHNVTLEEKNLAPVVTLRAPAGLTFTTRPAAMQMAASASDSDGTVSRVDFVAAGTVIASVATEPFEFTWNGVMPGTYVVTAVAYDNLGAETRSGELTFEVMNNQAPEIGLGPLPSTFTLRPQAVTVAATAVDRDGEISHVEFFAGETALGTANVAPFAVVWRKPNAGTFAITAVAYDNEGLATTSAPALITVPANVAPVVSIASPSELAFAATPAAIDIVASAADADGVVTHVDFYLDDALISSATAAPYKAVIANVIPGTFVLRVVAHDDDGATSTSAAVSMVVPEPKPVWELTALGGASSPVLGATPACTTSSDDCVGLSLTGASGNALTTAEDQGAFYYRSLEGDVTIVARIADLSGTHVEAKAGLMIRESLATGAKFAALHVNPSFVPVFRWRPVSDLKTSRKIGETRGVPMWVKLERRGNRFTGYESVDGVTWTQVYLADVALPQQVYAGIVVTGGAATSVADVTVTDVKVTTSDAVNAAPSVTMASPSAAALSQAAAGTLTLTAAASDSDGSVTKVEFFVGDTLIGTDTAAPFAATWTSVPVGTWTLKAVAYDDQGAATMSAPVTITVPQNTVEDTPAPGGQRWMLAFTASQDHDVNVDGYVLEILAPGTATALLVHELGKPSVFAGEISLDVTGVVGALPAGSYTVRVKAVNEVGSAISNTLTLVRP